MEGLDKAKEKFKKRILNLLRDKSSKRSYHYVLTNIINEKKEDEESDESKTINFLNFANNFERALDELISEGRIIKTHENGDDWYIFNKFPKKNS
jgi:hypothetical protein